jgi:hypothetical protein
MIRDASNIKTLRIFDNFMTIFNTKITILRSK